MEISAKIEKIVEETYLMSKFPDAYKERTGISKNKMREIIKENKQILSEFIGEDGIRHLEKAGYVVRKDKLGSVFVYTMASWVAAEEGFKKYGKSR